MTPAVRRLIYAVVTGAVLLAAIGFVGSYTAVRQLAEAKGFGTFALAFPIGIDAGIGVLLALDLILTWVRMPYPLLRQSAWILTTATIAFNAAAAWPDPLGVGMHAVIPLLFIVVVEAARHAVGRHADITADKHMEGVRLSRWLLAPLSTFKLWRRMKLWELRSYEAVIALEQERLIYRAQLQMRYGRLWRWSAPVEMRLPLRLTKYGRALTPLTDAPVAPALAVAAHPAADTDAEFDRVVSDATALAGPIAPAPAPAVEAAPDAPALAPADAHRAADAVHPHGALVLDLKPMLPPVPQVTADAHPTAPAAPASTRPAATASDDELIERARALAATGPLSLRRMQRAFGIGQARATRIRNALDREAS
ncbi:DUF2637 domain-containing protein [Streptomyces sp. MnatMP-M17]|uniref:DUF2637 domain-containing protein n=1 Tax=Streptomyces sp. SID4917 TaxID=2690269 RepID=UPI000B85FF7C|nr:DUF2637 domain-containing protein [Streptomyces sp. MnatMP-M17]MYZ35847.1 DUF2637 domain-containing protein [Streptomyces sp. SID4917]